MSWLYFLFILQLIWYIKVWVIWVTPTFWTVLQMKDNNLKKPKYQGWPVGSGQCSTVRWLVAPRAGSRKLWSADGGGAAREVSHLPPAEWYTPNRASLAERDTGGIIGGIPVSEESTTRRTVAVSVGEGDTWRTLQGFRIRVWVRNRCALHAGEEALILVQRKENIALGAGIKTEIRRLCKPG